mgnify:CR=1 FL=1
MSIAEDYDLDYEGTEPISDAENNYMSTMLIKLMSELYETKKKSSKKAMKIFIWIH